MKKFNKMVLIIFCFILLSGYSNQKQIPTHPKIVQDIPENEIDYELTEELKEIGETYTNNKGIVQFATGADASINPNGGYKLPYYNQNDSRGVGYNYLKDPNKPISNGLDKDYMKDWYIYHIIQVCR